MLSPEASMKPSRIAPEPMISFSPFPQRSRVRMSRSVWFLVALCITLLGSVEAQLCRYAETTYDCQYRGAQQTTMPSSFLTSTTRVSLSVNQITSIPVNCFQGLTALTQLYLNNNQITSIPVNSFQGLTALFRLYLHDNQITSIPVNAFQGLTALTYLWLYNNQITSIPVNSFQGLTALTSLYLYNNQITSIPVNIFQGLTALTQLRLYYNRITSIPVNSFQGLTALRDLYLYNNQITSIPVNAFQGLTALTSLYWTNSGTNNPLICSTAGGSNWLRPFVCGSCRNGLDFYQNSQFFMCSSTPPTLPPTVSPTPCDSQFLTNVWSNAVCGAFTPSDCVSPETGANCRLTCCSTSFPPTTSSPTSAPTSSLPTVSPTIIPSTSPTTIPTTSPTQCTTTNAGFCGNVNLPEQCCEQNEFIRFCTSCCGHNCTTEQVQSSTSESSTSTISTLTPTVSPSALPTIPYPTSLPITPPTVSPTQATVQSSQSDSSDSSLYIIIIGVVVAINFITIIAFIRYRKTHRPTPFSTPLPPNSPITTNPAYERAYSEIGPVYTQLDYSSEGGIATQPYAQLDSSRKAYEMMDNQPQFKYEVPSIPTLLQDSQPYDEVDFDISIRRDTGSFA